LSREFLPLGTLIAGVNLAYTVLYEAANLRNKS
jgi:hypothetical protein